MTFLPNSNTLLLQLRTLTPLHVGDGSQLHSFDYVLHGGHFYRVSQHRFEQFLQQIDAADDSLKNALAFADWANDMAGKIESLETDRRNAGRQGGRDYNQDLSRLRSEYNLLAFSKKVGQDRAFLDFLKKPENKVRALPLLMENGRPKQEIRGFQRDAEGRAYLPGSSVKGCIRTALLYHYLTEHADYQKIHELLNKEVAKIKADREEAERRRIRFSVERYRKSFGEALEYEAFNAGMVTERNQARPGEAQDDLMRCLLIADVALPEDGLGVDNIDLYLVKKMPKGQGNQAQRQPQSPAVEAVLPGQVLAVKLDFNLDLLLHLHRSNSSDEGFMVGREKHFIGWRKRAEWLFGLNAADFETVPPGIKPEDSRYKALVEKAFAHIFGCVQRFSDAQAAAYERWQKNYTKPDHNGKQDARNVDAGAKSIRANGLRLHMGFATGFEGMTEVLYLLAEHKRLFADIMELFAIGDSPSAWKNRRPGDTYRANPDQFPKSRRLASRNGAALPLGWLVQVEAGTQSQSWADSKSAHDFTTQKSNGLTPDQPITTLPPAYLRGTLKIGAEVNAEMLSGGNPGKFKLFIRADYEPTVEVKYPAGFKAEDVGRIALLRVKNLKGKEEVIGVEFVRFK